MMQKPAVIFGQSKGISFVVITSNLEFSSMCPKEETFPIPLKYFDVTRTTHKNLVVVQESRIEYYWNVDVDRSLSDSWTGFTKVTILTEKTSKKDMGGPGGGSHRFKQLPDLRICGLRCLAQRWQNFRHWETLHTVVKI